MTFLPFEKKVFSFTPIGYFHGPYTEKYQAPRQGVLQEMDPGRVRLLPHCHFEQALEDLKGFDRVWLLFSFNRCEKWKPKVQPPGRHSKKSVFATRSPHRPNFIGMSCVKLLQVKALELLVGEYDLLDQTPILDIKPYLSYSDSFPQASSGWLEEKQVLYKLHAQSTFSTQARLFQKEDGIDLMKGITCRLSAYPYPQKNNRIVRDEQGFFIAYKNYRVMFEVEEKKKEVYLISCFRCGN